MSHFNFILPLCFAVACTAFSHSSAHSQDRRLPTGRLTDRLGELITIEGKLPANARGGKGRASSLRVDTIDGVKLEKPRGIQITGFRIPPNKRCVLKGYETGAMIGTPPAVLQAAKELGQEPPDISQAAYQWYTKFVVLIVVAPIPEQIPAQRAEP